MKPNGIVTMKYPTVNATKDGNLTMTEKNEILWPINPNPVGLSRITPKRHAFKKMGTAFKIPIGVMALLDFQLLDFIRFNLEYFCSSNH
jgi:hypothetical protein